MSTYIRRKNSGVDGKKWKLHTLPLTPDDEFWRLDCLNLDFLPTCDYERCDPPENWVDVTDRCGMNGMLLVHHHGVLATSLFDDNGYITKGYRFTKLAGKFIIEQNQAS
jgi:hypothetical protein